MDPPIDRSPLNCVVDVLIDPKDLLEWAYPNVARQLIRLIQNSMTSWIDPYWKIESHVSIPWSD